MTSINLTIQADGSILIPRGTKEHNDIIRNLSKMFDEQQQQMIENFLLVTDDCELLLGDTTLCG